MARSTDAKCRKCRRAGEKLFLKGDRCYSPKCGVVRKAYAPGMHGKGKGSSPRGLSDFGKQLAMKQKIKRIYGVLEKQFRKHYEDIKGKQGMAGDVLMQRLEMRLDNVVYRMGLASSRAAARQLVAHGFFLVNGKKMDVPAFEVKVDNEVALDESKSGKEYFKNQKQILKNRKSFPQWVEFDAEKMRGKVTALPSRDDIGYSVDPQAVVEYYSK